MNAMTTNPYTNQNTPYADDPLLAQRQALVTAEMLTDRQLLVAIYKMLKGES